ncbi:serine/threonine-protein kinase 31 isoform X11 [Ochotona princeps]|uniref:serine/threonine-protein kinase 31 isoform X11 n=1 Tax=Ochotona princeps TaxID=9978 RepID=UPI002714F418|nr:serine/threonine-protein kinase 31 isoform X11 [Ochotona princeps]
MWGQGHFSRASVAESVSFPGVVQMDEDTHYNKVEDVVGSHVEDAVTFWAQSIDRNKDIVKIGLSLSEVCPHANSVFGSLDPKKIYGGLFSEDKCWYRCKVLKIISDEKCLVRYIDYGNTEILNRSDIVEIPSELQFSSVAKKYRLWGLQIPSGQEVTQFDQGRTFLGSLIFEKEIKMRIKATYQDGTVIAQAEYGSVDIGEEVAKKGFAEKCKLTSGNDICEEKKSDPAQLALRNLKNPIPLWGHRSNQTNLSRPKPRLSGRLALDLKNENDTGSHMTFTKESLAVGDFKLGSNVSLAKIKQDQKLIEENEKLKTEKEVLLERYKALESKVEQTTQELQQEKANTMDLTKHLESTLKTRVGTRMKNLATKVEILKEIRRVNTNVRFGDDLSEAMQVLDEGCLTILSSLNELEVIWAEYSLAQEKIKTCEDVNEGNILIAERNEVQQKLYVAVEVFILEVDELPLNKRLKTLKDLSAALEAAYGQATEGANSEDILRKFYDWKCDKREEFSKVRTETEASLQRLVAWFQSSLQVFDLSVEEPLSSDDTVDNIDEILEKTESCLCKELEISLIEQGDADKEIILNTYGQVLQKIRSEERLIASVQAKYKDSTEEKLNSLAQKWFPELPLLYPEIGLLKYMGYSVDVDMEARVIKRAAAYHRAWRAAREEPGLLPLKFLFLCKSDPMAYLVVPYHPRASLSAVQAIMPLTSEEALKVMKGVAHGLHTLHKAGIIHGSLHQNNVFAVNREQGIVGDFDFTKSVSQRAAVNMMVGDLSLMSPELKMGKPPSASSDLYAYGCLLLWLSVQNQEFETNEDGIPKVDQFHLDDSVKSLLCSLIFCRSSVTAEQVLNAECFLLPKEKSVSDAEKDTECTQHKKEEELKMENLDKFKEKTKNGEATVD